MRNLIAAALVAALALFAPLATAWGAQRAMVVVGGGTLAAARFSTASLTSYVPIGGATSEVISGGSIAMAQTPWRGAGTFSNFSFDPVANTRTTPTVVCLNVDGVDVADTCETWTTGQTEARLDLSTVVNIAEGALVCLSVTTGSGTGVFTLAPVSFQFTTAGQVFTHMSALAPNGAPSTTAARNWFMGGRLDVNNVEANATVKALEAFTASNLTVGLSSNAGSAVPFTARKNLADTALTLTTGTGAGFTEATAASVGYAPGDTFSVSKAASASAVTTARVGFKYQGAVPGRVMQMAQGLPSISATAYVAPGMSSLGETSEPAAQVRVPFDSTVSKLSVLIYQSTSTQDIVVDLMKGGVSVRSFTVPAGSTFPGTFTDPSGAEDAFAAGDLLDVRISGFNNGIGVSAVTFLHTDSNATSAGVTHRRRALLRGVR